ncbi:GyrI-like domain-containing protein [Lysinibacillus endophyticus]|uniref:AraC family transcriptional regulator n=1 Tax=Ureibacillus endophyticus TaxID=1978490 RepID=A0A494YVP0_9BACL|nr:GyrI-like domain-containing protein [Lysinibacillus endophyticus]RKQ14214.1 AraC family transcriptional regulator [Lysinibacillus endophyticus]
MANYSIEEKNSFTVLGIGTEIKSHYTDFVGINKEKADFWQSINEDGTLEKLKSVASNDYLFVVNEAVNNKMMHYAGVMTEESLPETTRLIEFPKGEYIVVKGEANSDEELANVLTGMAFGQVLGQVTEVSYVGGPNTAVIMGQKDGKVYGEMWIPVVRN